VDDVPEVARTVTTGAGAAPPRRLLRGGEQLRRMIGNRLLVGVTLRDAGGGIEQRRQFHGTVLDVAEGVVVLGADDGSQVLLPADPAAYERARPGTYRLLGGGVVRDPDFLATWDVVPEPEDP